jgi:hypothetical protein
MRKSLVLVGLSTLACLGPKETKFAEEFDEAYCNEARICLGQTDPCESLSPSVLQTCDDYSKKAAKACLDEEFICVNGAVVPPSDCDDACGAPLISEEVFTDEFTLILCSEQRKCDEEWAEFFCSTTPADGDGEEGEGEGEPCNFNDNQAMACLLGAWTCDDEIGLVTLPEACGDVCD